MKSKFTYKALFAALLLSVIFVFSACSSDNEAPPATEKPMQTEQPSDTEPPITSDDNMESEAPADDTIMEGEKVFTLQELSQYDGKDGRPAYVAVDGVVYDVSDKPLWAGGEHQNKVSAGQDLSEAILLSPHGKSKLNDLPVVGTLAED